MNLNDSKKLFDNVIRINEGYRLEKVPTFDLQLVIGGWAEEGAVEIQVNRSRHFQPFGFEGCISSFSVHRSKLIRWQLRLV